MRPLTAADFSVLSSNNPGAAAFPLAGNGLIHRIGLGTMRFADDPRQRRGQHAPIWGPPSDWDASVATLRHAAELGVTLFDTAAAYALGAGERLVGQALEPFRDQVVIATKVGLTRPGPGEWGVLGRPDYLRQQIEQSRRALGGDRPIDLLYLHAVDEQVPLADQLGVLADAVRRGDATAVGLSQVSLSQLDEAVDVITPAAVQVPYNLADRANHDVLVRAGELGAAFVPFFPLGMGDAAGMALAVEEVAAELDATAAQVALAWLLHQAPHVVPIPGTTSADRVAENLAAAELSLTSEQLTRLVPPPASG